jgi:hypothetical protein
MGLSRRDRAAMKLAIEQVRAEGEASRKWIDGRKFYDAGALAAYHCQYRALGLKPWEWSPSWVDPAEIDALLATTDHDNADRRVAARLLRRMLAVGVSRWHPDPMAAIAAAVAVNKKAPRAEDAGRKGGDVGSAHSTRGPSHRTRKLPPCRPSLGAHPV